MNSSACKHYLARFFSLLVVALVLLGVFNFTVDPYGAVKRWWRQSDDSPLTSSYSSRIVKANELAGGNFEFAILGSSRSELGIDPQSNAFAGLGKGYNAALPGSNLSETRKVVEYLVERHSIRELYLSLELVMFSRYRTSVDDFDRSLFVVDSIDDRINFEGRMLWGAGTTKRSFQSLLAKENEADYVNGFRSAPESPGNAAELSSALTRYYLESPEAFYDYELSEERWEDLIAIVESCDRHEIKLFLFFPPVHAEFLEVIQEAGLAEVLEELKKRVVKDERLNGLQENGLLEVWDFNSYRGIQAEPLPDPDALPGEMQFYYEISHFRPKVGAAMIRQMRNGPTQNEEGVELDGVQLTAGNVDTHLESLRTNRARYLQSTGW